jgi:purine-binding chemotaxis protein CheW
MSENGADSGWDLTPEGESFDWGDSDEGAETGPDVIRCAVGDHLFAIEAAHVREVVSPLPTTEVPRLPGHILGVAMYRRRVVSVVDLARFLGLESAVSIDQGRLLVTMADDLHAALRVDSVSGIEPWPEDSESEKLSQDVDPKIREYAAGARWAPGGVVVLLDVDRLLQSASVR